MIVLLAAAALLAEAPTPADQLQGLEQVYAESCANRGYGQYDDMCDQMQNQIRRLRTEAAKRPKKKAEAQAPAPVAHLPSHETAVPVPADSVPVGFKSSDKPPG